MDYMEGTEPDGPRVLVIGVGGGGVNALNAMMEQGVCGMEYLAVNTDSVSLENSRAPRKILIGKTVTRGLGAGADPQKGREAVLEDLAEIRSVIGNADMVVVVAGMGGGTGTGATPVIAQIAQEQGALTVGIVTSPFYFEGKNRLRMAMHGIAAFLQQPCSLIVIAADRLIQLMPGKASFADMLRKADDTLCSAVRGVTDCLFQPGLIGCDFADLAAIMVPGVALLGEGRACGTNRAREAAMRALAAPTFEDCGLRHAAGVQITITAGPDITIEEIAEASTLIQEEAHEDARVFFACHCDAPVGDEMRVSVIAAGISDFVIPSLWEYYPPTAAYCPQGSLMAHLLRKEPEQYYSLLRFSLEKDSSRRPLGRESRGAARPAATLAGETEKRLLEETGCAFDAESGILHIRFPWDGGEMRIHPWASHCRAEVRRDGTWREEPCDFPLAPVFAACDDPAHPIAAFAATLPALVTAMAAGYGYDQLPMMQACSRSDRALEMAASAPTLLWFLAPFLVSAPHGRGVHDLLGEKRHVLVGYVCGRNEPWLARFIAALPPTRNIAVARKIVNKLLATPQAMEALRHHDTPSWAVLDLAARNTGIFQTLPGRNLFKGSSDAEAIRQEISRYGEQLRDAARLGGQLGINGHMSLIDACKTFQQLRALHESWSNRMQRVDFAKVIRKNGNELPPPPLAGTEHIKPITTLADLLLEGKTMRHCVGSYQDAVRRGTSYIYQVLHPARATLEIRRAGKREWAIAQIKSHCNSTPGKETIRAVQQWLAEAAACAGTGAECGAQEPENACRPQADAKATEPPSRPLPADWDAGEFISDEEEWEIPSFIRR